MGPPMSFGSMLLVVVAAGLWQAFLLSTAWGRKADYYANGLEGSALSNPRRAFNGRGNNVAQPEWGSVGQRQLRSVIGASYPDRVSTPPGEDRPTPREVLSEVFLATPPSSSTTSTLFVGWGLLIGYDLFLNWDNASEPLDIACDDASLADGSCRRGSLSGPISFNRSQGELDAEGDGARSPINYATAYMDLDWLYGRDEESAAALRTMDAGNLNLTADELPHLMPDGTWLVADQRPTKMPVTFALMTLLLREHNRCCNEMAPAWNADTDEDAYQACRQWTIAVFQHISENEFSERLVGGSARYLGSAAYNFFYDEANYNNTVNARRKPHRLSAMEIIVRSRHLARMSGSYDAGTNAGVDTVFSTVANPALFSALPSTVGLRDDNYHTIDEHGIELAAASADVAGLIERIGGIESIVRGATYSRAHALDVSFTVKAPPSSPLFNLPIVAIQRGRDHGIPSYNDVRQACGFSRVTSFEDVTADETIQERLAYTYGDVELLDAYTGVLAENEDGSGLFAGPLLRAVFLEQLYRAIVGDRHYHSHSMQNEDTRHSTLSGLILDNSYVSSVPLDTFAATDTAVVTTGTHLINFKEVFLADGYKIAWDGWEKTEELMHIKISAKGIDLEGMIGVGFGGDKMGNTGDFVVCMVSPESTAMCSDHSGPKGHDMPPMDPGNSSWLEVVNVTWDGEWTSVTFLREGQGNDLSDYHLTTDIAARNGTSIIYSWRSGEGTDKHPTDQRGSAVLNFADGTLRSACSGSGDYYALHGALLLFVWLIVAPYGIYQARYRKGRTTLIGNLWWEVHEDCMVICAEALLPLAITAIFTTGGPHNSSHAKWGFYMIGAIILQIVTGWARTRALTGKSNNFSRVHRANKHIHIYAGWFAYISGLVQCYRGLELVSGTDKLVFSAAEIDFTLGSFDVVTKIVFPIWIALVPLVFIVLEVQKQFTRYFDKGAANLCGVVEIINEEFSDEAILKKAEDRLMPRTEELPLYTTHEFNAKILNGRSWVIVDGAVLDFGAFVKRHPGGARVLMNVMGTDVTSEIIGEDASIGNSSMTFNPHTHTNTALEIARSLIVGYIEEEDDIETDQSDEEDNGGKVGNSGTDGGFFNRPFLHASRASSHSGSDSEGNDRRGLSGSSHRSRRSSRFSISSRPSFGRDKSTNAGRLPSWSGPAFSGDEVEGRRPPGGRRRTSSRTPRRTRTTGGSGGSGSGSDTVAEQIRAYSSDGSTDGERRRQLSASESKSKTKKTPGGVVPVGAAVILSAEAAAIVNTKSPPATKPELPTRGKNETEEKNDAVPSVPVDTSMIELSPTMPVSPRPDQPRKRLSTRSISSNKPVELNHPVVMHTSSSFKAKVKVKKASKSNPVRRIFSRRVGPQIDASSGAVSDESIAKQGNRPNKAMRKVWGNKNLLDFFHVCPLLVHQKMGDGGNRPVYKFVFACPGRAAAMVEAMMGVCHFRMRAAKEAGMTVVQRSYNAFAVRVQGEEGTERRVVPASETDEGELCIEMWIRLYPDGLMSNLLLQLIKNSDNPAVQLQGPFLQDRVIPPPAHRNVVMIAAGTGVNPMVSLIRDYINPDSHTPDVLLGAHSRLVLLWQNNAETDLFCVDELTALQTQAKGLLEVTAMISGDITRRNVPGNAFRRAKARLIKKGIEAGLVNRGADATGDAGANGGGAGDQASERGTSSGAGASSEFKQDEENNGDGLIGGTHLRGHRLTRELSRVTEEDNMSIASSFRNSSRTFGARDLESGDGVSSLRSSTVLYEGAEEETPAEIGGGGGNTDAPSPIREGSIEGSADDSGRSIKASTARRQARGAPSRDKEAAQSTGPLEGARRPRRGALIADSSMSGSGEREDGGDSGGDDASPILLLPLRSRSKGRRIRASPTLARQRASRNISDGSSDVSGRVSEDARAPSDSSGEGVTRGGIRLAGPFRQASVSSGHSPRTVHKKESTGRANEASGGSGGGDPVQPTLDRSRSPEADIVAHSSGEEGSIDPDGGASPSRSLRRGGSKGHSARSGVNTHSHSSARRTRRKSSSNRSLRDEAAEHLAGSPLDDSGSGIQNTKLSKVVLERAFGPEVMKAIASVKASDVAGAAQEGSAHATDASRSALNALIGNETTGGALQVVVSGPAGFVFYAEGLLAEMGIPPQAVVLLD